MDKENKYGMMACNMKEIGKMVSYKDRVNFIMPMVIDMKDNLRIVSLMAQVYIFILMESNIKVSGKITN